MKLFNIYYYLRVKTVGYEICNDEHLSDVIIIQLIIIMQNQINDLIVI